MTTRATGVWAFVAVLLGSSLAKADTTMTGKLWQQSGTTTIQMPATAMINFSAKDIQGNILSFNPPMPSYNPTTATFTLTVASPTSWPGGDKRVVISFLRAGASTPTTITVLGDSINNNVQPVLK